MDAELNVESIRIATRTLFTTLIPTHITNINEMNAVMPVLYTYSTVAYGIPGVDFSYKKYTFSGIQLNIGVDSFLHEGMYCHVDSFYTRGGGGAFVNA